MKPTKRYKTSSATAQAVIHDPNIDKTDPGFKEDAVERERCRRELEKFRTHVGMRDELIRDAINAGLTDSEIEEISGVARSTIRRIEGRAD
jgi:hypothetical protein